MARYLEIAVTGVVTLALFFSTAPFVARVLRLSRAKAQLPATVLRFLLAILLAGGLWASGAEHRVAMVFTVGAAYFAGALIDGVLQFRRLGGTETAKSGSSGPTSGEPRAGES